MEKAQARQAALLDAQEKADRLAEARAYFASVITVGMDVKHRVFGLGQIIAADDQYLTIVFPQKGETKKFATMMSFSGGFLTADIPDMAEKAAKYKDVINGERTIESTLARAQAEFNEYREYLE